MTDHHHFVCVQCGLTKDFCSDKPDQLKIAEEVQSIGYAESTHVEVNGVCLECAANDGQPRETL